MSIVDAVLFGLAIIWGIVKDEEFIWKVFATLGIFFCAALLTIQVARFIASRHWRG